MTKKQFHFIVSLVILLFAMPSAYAQIAFTEHTVVTSYNSWSAVTIDMDYDGDIDIVGSARLHNGIHWWENDGEQNFTRHTVSDNAAYAMGVCAADFDYDNDIDIVCGLNQAAQIKWYENDGNFNFTEHLIANWVVNRVLAVDVNGDSVIDVVASACEQGDNKMGWFENDGRGNFTAHVVKDNWDHANSIYATDVDRDGDVDLLGTASFRTTAASGEIAWFENDGSENFVMHKIKENYGRPSSVYAADVDLDGDVDVMATACGVNQIMWFENDGNQQFTQNLLGTNFLRPHDVKSVDIDNDGDIDILGVATDSNEISWWENDGSQNFTKQIITTSFNGATEIFIKDIDQDGDLDVLGAAQYVNKISWFENNLYRVHFRTDVTSGHAPLTIQFEDLSNLEPPITHRAWDFENDGTIDSNEKNPTWTYQGPGNYTVVLEVANDSISKKIMYKDIIHVFDGVSALLFNGIDSYASCPAAPGLSLTEAMTIEAWIRPHGWGSVPNLGFGRIVDKGHISIFLNGQGGGLSRHSLATWLSTVNGTAGFTNTPENSISLDEWQHLAITYDGNQSELKMYINGIEQPTRQVSGQLAGNISDNSNTNLLIGNSASHMAFDGIIDETRIWNTVRNDEEIQRHKNHYLRGDEAGLVAYWQMDEGNGSILDDGSGHGNIGTLENANWAQGINLNAPTAIKRDQRNIRNQPENFYLSQNYPNPFNATTKITFHLPQQVNLKMNIFDTKGRLVKTISCEQNWPSGAHSIQWNGTNNVGNEVSSGLYFCKFEAGKFTRALKLLLLR